MRKCPKAAVSVVGVWCEESLPGWIVIEGLVTEEGTDVVRKSWSCRCEWVKGQTESGTPRRLCSSPGSLSRELAEKEGKSSSLSGLPRPAPDSCDRPPCSSAPVSSLLRLLSLRGVRPLGPRLFIAARLHPPMCHSAGGELEAILELFGAPLAKCGREPVPAPSNTKQHHALYISLPAPAHVAECVSSFVFVCRSVSGSRLHPYFCSCPQIACVLPPSQRLAVPAIAHSHHGRRPHRSHGAQEQGQ
jgi:hypothetical protein